MIDRPVFIVNVVSGYKSYKRQGVYENEILLCTGHILQPQKEASKVIVKLGLNNGSL